MSRNRSRGWAGAGVWSAGLVGALLLGGCQVAAPADPTEAVTRGEEIATGRFPVPEGFAFVPEKSFRHHTNFKAAKLRYEKSNSFSDLSELVAFYEEELPKRGWRINFVYGRRTRKISAEKDGETCDIILARRFRERQLLIVIRTAETEPS